MLKATVNGLQRLRRPEEVAQIRGLTVSQVLPVPTRPAVDEEVEAATTEEPEDAPPAAEETSDGEDQGNPDA
jgi:hypothetical protein